MQNICLPHLNIKAENIKRVTICSARQWAQKMRARDTKHSFYHILRLKLLKGFHMTTMLTDVLLCACKNPKVKF